jgi:two-component system chemotaxis response regulator CheB
LLPYNILFKKRVSFSGLSMASEIQRHSGGETMIRVVLIDDSSLARKFLKDVLERSGSIQIIGSAASAEDAMKILADYQPDVIVTDLLMPGLQGEIIVKIFHRQTPVVVVTSADADDAAVTQVQGIASAVILKPKVDADVEKFCRNLADAIKAAAADQHNQL